MYICAGGLARCTNSPRSGQARRTGSQTLRHMNDAKAHTHVHRLSYRPILHKHICKRSGKSHRLARRWPCKKQKLKHVGSIKSQAPRHLRTYVVRLTTRMYRHSREIECWDTMLGDDVFAIFVGDTPDALFCPPDRLE